MDLSEFKASLLNTESSRTARVSYSDPVSKTKQIPFRTQEDNRQFCWRSSLEEVREVGGLCKLVAWVQINQARKKCLIYMKFNQI